MAGSASSSFLGPVIAGGFGPTPPTTPEDVTSSPSTSGSTLWFIRMYDLDGGPLTYEDYYGETRDYLRNATDRSLEINLNGIDKCTFTLYLDDPAALLVRRLTTVVKVWRQVFDNTGSLIYEDPAEFPAFAGVVASTVKRGQQGTMEVTAFSPFWRLQFRFHLLNHYLKINPLEFLDWTHGTGDPFKQTELMWYLIWLINNAFGHGTSSASFTGIDIEGSTAFSLDFEVEMGPKFLAKGSNTYSNIFDDIMERPGGVDIMPVYVHTDDDPRLMLFDTVLIKGADLTESIVWSYHMDANGGIDNLEDLVESVIVQPGPPSSGGFGNYYWAVGAGGPNSGLVAEQENSSGTLHSDGYEEIGIYMLNDDHNEIKLLGLEDGGDGNGTDLKGIAQFEFLQVKVPETTYEVVISPVMGMYYDYHFTVGDVITLNASKGALSVNEVAQRIYNVTLTISDNNIETCAATISSDFGGRIVS